MPWARATVSAKSLGSFVGSERPRWPNSASCSMLRGPVSGSRPTLRPTQQSNWSRGAAASCCGQSRKCHAPPDLGGVAAANRWDAAADQTPLTDDRRPAPLTRTVRSAEPCHVHFDVTYVSADQGLAIWPWWGGVGALSGSAGVGLGEGDRGAPHRAQAVRPVLAGAGWASFEGAPNQFDAVSRVTE
jgi:hypothetical protein